MPSSLPQAAIARVGAALDRGRGAAAAQILAPVLKSSTLTRDDELALRSMLAEAWLLQDDLDQAAAALGRPPDTFRETVPPGRLSTLWRLHGRLAYERGDQSRPNDRLPMVARHRHRLCEHTPLLRPRGPHVPVPHLRQILRPRLWSHAGALLWHTRLGNTL